MRVTLEQTYNVEFGGDQLILDEVQALELRDELIKLLAATGK